MFLQRIVGDQPESRRNTDMASNFANQYGVGRVAARWVVYSSEDWEAAGRLLDASGIPRERQVGPLRRAETFDYAGISEKAFGERPHANEVAVRSAAGQCFLNGMPLAYPDGCYSILRVDDVLSIRCDRILVVENLETFKYLGRYGWIDYGGLATLAIFRGDNAFNLADASKAIAARSEPVLAFTDFDPAGLAIAARLPRLAGLVLPELDWLAEVTRQKRRTDLYHSQIGQFDATLDAARHPDIVRAAALLRDLRSGYSQEWMEAAPTRKA